MDRLISLEPSNVVLIRIEQSQKCYGELTLRNVMHTMPVAFWLQPMNKMLYKISPQSGIISPLTTVTIEIIYESNLNSVLPESFPYCDDSFLLHSAVVPGAANKVLSSTFDTISSDWFTTKKKQVFTDSGVKVMFAGSLVLVQLVKNGAMEKIRDVLEKCDPSWKAANSVDSDGQTLLHLTINQSRPDLVQLLLEFDLDIEAKSGSGSTPLETATASKEALIVELLLARGANVERSESCNYGPIHFASGGGNIEILKLLLFKNANVNALTKDGSSALHRAVEERHKDCVKLLLDSGAKPDIRNVVDGDTPLHIATALGDEHMVKLLLQKGANKDIRNRVGKTAYDIALNNGHNRLFDALRLGESLSIAARKGDVRTIQRLLEYGASINGRDQRGWTALHRASFKGRLETVRALIEKGIEIDGKDEDGYSALHCAVESGHVEIVELLVKKGADLEGRTSKGVSAIQIAETLHYSGITRVLINGGATSEGSEKEMINNRVVSKSTIVKGKGGKEKVYGIDKNKGVRGRGMRSSFGRSMQLAVV